MFSIAQASSLAKDGCEIKLLFSNKTKNDILIGEQLEELQKINESHLKVFHTLTRHNEKDGSWDGLQGRVSYEML